MPNQCLALDWLRFRVPQGWSPFNPASTDNSGLNAGVRTFAIQPLQLPLRLSADCLMRVLSACKNRSPSPLMPIKASRVSNALCITVFSPPASASHQWDDKQTSPIPINSLGGYTEQQEDYSAALDSLLDRLRMEAVQILRLFHYSIIG